MTPEELARLEALESRVRELEALSARVAALEEQTATAAGNDEAPAGLEARIVRLEAHNGWTEEAPAESVQE